MNAGKGVARARARGNLSKSSGNFDEFSAFVSLVTSPLTGPEGGREGGRGRGRRRPPRRRRRAAAHVATRLPSSYHNCKMIFSYPLRSRDALRIRENCRDIFILAFGAVTCFIPAKLWDFSTDNCATCLNWENGFLAVASPALRGCGES